MTEEKFMVTVNIPGYLVNHLDTKRGDISRSVLTEDIIEEKIKKIPHLLNDKKTKDITLNLSFNTIEKIKETAQKYNTTEGRVIYLCLLMKFFEDMYLASKVPSASASALPSKKGEKNGDNAKKKRKQSRKGNSKLSKQ